MKELIPRKNPLLRPDIEWTIRRKIQQYLGRTTGTVTANRKRIVRRALGEVNAAAAIRGFDKETDVIGYTAGRFSLVDLIYAVIGITGPVAVDLSTWTAASADASDLIDLMQSGQITTFRAILDASFARRKPEVLKVVMEKFGRSSIRITDNHAKFVRLTNDEWTVTIRTSMNLNQNPRFEDFDVSNSFEIHSFIGNVVDDIFNDRKWSRKRNDQDCAFSALVKEMTE